MHIGEIKLKNSIKNKKNNIIKLPKNWLIAETTQQRSYRNSNNIYATNTIKTKKLKKIDFFTPDEEERKMLKIRYALNNTKISLNSYSINIYQRIIYKIIALIYFFYSYFFSFERTGETEYQINIGKLGYRVMKRNAP